MVCRAHDGPAEAAAEARAQLFSLYEGAVRRYLLTALRDPDAADELVQEFALRFCRGDFRTANPGQGRFRDFLGVALRNLVIDHRRRQQHRPRQLGPADSEPAVENTPDVEAERAFLASWRDELMHRSWERLAAVGTKVGRQWYAVLRLRAEHPEARSPRLAELLGEAEGKPVTPEAARQLLHRARAKFADLLVEEVARSLDSPTREQLDRELGELGLLEYCRSALDGRGGG
jgi:RNA polymerase sigma factor (sigma-70 family)